VSSLIEVPEYAVHAEVRVDPARTALVVVDMQNDFVREGGGLLVPDAAATIPAMTALLELARAHEMRVVYSQDTHREGDPEWQIWPEHAREGSRGWEIIDELAPARDDVVLRKPRYDAFYGTPLDHMLRLWGIVLSGNLVGTFLFALTVAKLAVFDAHTQQCLVQIGLAHLGAGFWTVLVRAIFAGWLIALMVWLLPGAESARVSIIVIITFLVGIGGFNHIIAGSTTLFFLVATNHISWQSYLIHFFVPVLLGNMVGGISLVAALGHVQVVGGRDNAAAARLNRKKAA